MKIDYQAEYRKQLQKNIQLVRKEIDNPDFVLKIRNHAEKFDREYDEVKNKILNDDMYAEIFAKDPAKQNIYENLASEYLKQNTSIKNFKNLPNNTKKFIVNGELTTERQNDVKSIDFEFNYMDKNIYVSHKYIKALNGGAQDNQYNDIRNFLRNCNKCESGTNYFIAICDGPYFERKLENLNEEFGSSNVIAITIDEFESFLEKIK
jgi:hypothetical protein